MNLDAIAQSLHTNATPLTITLFVLLVVSEVFGSVDSIKASSIYGLAKVLLATLKDQVWPVKTP